MSKQKQQQAEPVQAKTAKQETQPQKTAVVNPTSTLQYVYVNPHTLTQATVATLQRMVGNQTMGRLVVQRKMTVGPVNDPYEQEADAMAKQVVHRMHTVQKAPADVAQRQEEEEELQMKSLPTISTLQRQEEEEEALQMQTAVVGTQGGEITNSLEQSIQRARGGGQTMPAPVRRPMEQAFNTDFSQVKIHADSASDGLNRSLSARAFTTGSDIFFRSGEYNPGSSSGQELLAHELTHTIQQSGAAVRPKLQRSRADLIQTHSINEAPPLPEEAIQTKRLLQRHSINEAPPLPEDEELQTKSLLQRQPYDSPIQTTPQTSSRIQRLEMRRSDLETGGIGVGGFWYEGDLQNAVRFYHEGVKGSTVEAHKKLLQNILDKCDQFDTQEEEAVKKNKWMEANKGKRLATVQKLRLEVQEEVKQLADYAEFIKQPYTFENYTIGLNGKFDVDYQPQNNLTNINVKVKFTFPDDVVPSPEDIERQEAYRKKFAESITTAWSNRYKFKNVRKPEAVWGRLSPTDVQVNVKEVDADQHFAIQVKPETEGRASVGGGVTKLWKGDDVAQEAFNPGTQTGELERVRRIIPQVQFANNSKEVAPQYKPSLEFLATYLKRINNPKFKLEIIGHASKTGQSSANQTISEQRAEAVKNMLAGAGLTNHTVEASGVGETGATADGAWRKVEIKHSLEDSSWKNLQDVTPHEFGHMIGLGDEYGSGVATHYDLTKKAFGQEYADQVAKRGDTDYASVMEGGNDVRIQHYVTFWDALVATTQQKAAVPTPKLGHDDWQFIG